MDNRQQLLSQYVYPGLGEDAASGESVPRAAYPHDACPELAEPRAKLSTEAAAAAGSEAEVIEAAAEAASESALEVAPAAEGTAQAEEPAGSEAEASEAAAAERSTRRRLPRAQARERQQRVGGLRKQSTIFSCL